MQLLQGIQIFHGRSHIWDLPCKDRAGCAGDSLNHCRTQGCFTAPASPPQLGRTVATGLCTPCAFPGTFVQAKKRFGRRTLRLDESFHPATPTARIAVVSGWIVFSHPPAPDSKFLGVAHFLRLTGPRLDGRDRHFRRRRWCGRYTGRDGSRNRCGHGRRSACRWSRSGRSEICGVHRFRIE